MASQQRRRFVSSPLFVAAAGFVAGALVAGGLAISFFSSAPGSMRIIRESDIASSTQYTFTDPLVIVSSDVANPSPAYASLEQSVQSYLSQAEATGGLSSASLTFRDINNQSEGFSINPSETYDPASLTKIPLAMAYYELSEQDSSVLSQMIFYSGTPDLDASEQVESPVQLTPGQSYTVEDMIEHMIEHSDNNAEQLLADHLSAIGELGVLNSLFDNLGVKVNPNNPDYATVGSYSTFLRVLYNATYLNRDDSEKLLALMSKSDFTEGIDAGVPNGVLVAQKFGDAKIPDAQGAIVGAELQNCGIVYYPEHPYVLCIMTKGDSVADLEQVIAGISKIIFQDMEKRYPQDSTR